MVNKLSSPIFKGRERMHYPQTDRGSPSQDTQFTITTYPREEKDPEGAHY